MKTVQNFGNLAVRELPYRLKYRSFGSLMPDMYKSLLRKSKLHQVEEVEEH
jgi:hypothetical protein